MSLKELRSLAPFGWDSRITKHPVGKAIRNDFEKIDESSWAKQADGAGPASTPAPESRERRRSTALTPGDQAWATPAPGGQNRKAASADRAKSLKRKAAEQVQHTPDARARPSSAQQRSRSKHSHGHGQPKQRRASDSGADGDADAAGHEHETETEDVDVDMKTHQQLDDQQQQEPGSTGRALADSAAMPPPAGSALRTTPSAPPPPPSAFKGSAGKSGLASLEVGAEEEAEEGKAPAAPVPAADAAAAPGPKPPPQQQQTGSRSPVPTGADGGAADAAVAPRPSSLLKLTPTTGKPFVLHGTVVGVVAGRLSAAVSSGLSLTQQQLGVLGQLLAHFRATGCRHPASMTAAELVAAITGYCKASGIPAVPANIQTLASWLGALLALERPTQLWTGAHPTPSVATSSNGASTAVAAEALTAAALAGHRPSNTSINSDPNTTTHTAALAAPAPAGLPPLPPQPSHPRRAASQSSGAPSSALTNALLSAVAAATAAAPAGKAAARKSAAAALGRK
eukprot:XP_001696904.1 predicted protein [Chlamydomonas reinhardtii]